MKRLFVCLLCLMLALAPALSIAETEAAPDIRLLFTTDIHSHAVVHTAQVEGKSAQVGGYARLKTAVDAHTLEGRTLLLDSGDYSMATLYQTFTVSDALDLTLMQAIGFDAVALGNHDFEVTEDGLKSELTLFREKGGTFPLLSSNLVQSGDAKPEADANPLIDYGVHNYTVLERNGLRVGVFALMGKEASSYTPVTTLAFADPVKTAKAVVKQLRDVEKVDLVVLLDHAGTMPNGSFHEDADIAKAVDGIDVILSGHMHVPMTEKQVVNGAVIVCAGTALNELGQLDLTRDGDGWRADYSLIPLTDEWAEDTGISAMLEPFTEKLDAEYFTAYDVPVKQNDAIAVSPYDFPDGDTMCQRVDNYAFGSLIADAYIATVRSYGADAQIGMTPVGSVRGGLYQGKLLMGDLYNALSYGISPLDGSPASPMVSVWLTGAELYDLCETSISISQIMNTAQLLMGGIRYTYSDLRPLFNKVYGVEVYNSDSATWETVARSSAKLYALTCSWQSMQSIGLIKSSSYGLLSIEPKDAQGNLLDTLDEQKASIVRKPDGVELKEWDTLYQYLQTMDKGEDGLPVIDARYGQPGDYVRKADSSIATFFVSPNKAAWIQYGVVAFLLAVIVLTVHLIRRHRRKKKARAAKA